MVQCDSVLLKNYLIGISHCFLVPADITPVQINKGLLFQ